MTTGSKVAATEFQSRIVRVVAQGPQGPQGPTGDSGIRGERGTAGSAIELEAAVALGGHRVVALNELGQAIYASSTDETHALRVVGITTSATVAGAIAEVVPIGKVTEPTWNWNSELPVYLGTNGHLTQTVPAAPSRFSLVIGFPISGSSLYVNPGVAISLAQ